MVILLPFLSRIGRPEADPVFSSFEQSSAVIENMSRYVSPVNPAVYPQLTIVLLAIGIFFMAWFIV